MIVEELVTSELQDITLLTQIQRLTGGFGGCSVYLMQPAFNRPAPNLWIVKVGPSQEIEAEDSGWEVAKGYVPNELIANRIKHVSDGENGLLVFEYGGDGRTKVKDLGSAMKSAFAEAALEAVCSGISRWLVNLDRREVNITADLEKSLANKWERMPESIKATEACPTLNSPDYGEIYANPIYYFAHHRQSAKRWRVPLGFSHGDLHIHNALFGYEDGEGGLDFRRPIFIDFRFANDESWAVNDFAKLEASIRYTALGRVGSSKTLQQMLALLAASRAALKLGRCPETITDKSLQESWRLLAILREKVADSFREESDALAYFAALMRFAIAYATYKQTSPEAVSLAYLDAAALFTSISQPVDRTSTQSVFSAHSEFSPSIATPGDTSRRVTYASRLRASLAQSSGVVFVGELLGRKYGVSGLNDIYGWIHEDIVKTRPPSISHTLIRQILAKKSTRSSIRKSLARRVSRLPEKVSFPELSSQYWVAVLNYHVHPAVWDALRSNEGGAYAVRLETIEEVAAFNDSIAKGYTAFLPLLGDLDSNDACLVLTNEDRDLRASVVNSLATAIDQRQRPFSIVFWKHEASEISQISEFRDLFIDGLTSLVDTYYVSENLDEVRDATLESLDIWPVHESLNNILDGIEKQSSRTSPSSDGCLWQSGDIAYPLPDVERLSNGLVVPFTRVGSVVPIGEQEHDFLLGGPPKVEDIEMGRIVARHELHERIMPAIRESLLLSTDAVNTIILQGRAGAGVSTSLVLAGYEIQRDVLAPVFSALRSGRRSGSEWRRGALLLAEISRTTGAPSVLLLDSAEVLNLALPNIEDAVAAEGGRVVCIVGGRLDEVEQLNVVVSRTVTPISVDDALREAEWPKLADILQHNGFATNLSREELSGRLSQARHLLAAIYEATDRRNRKFREIVTYEYRRLDVDKLVQRAYRLICCVGTFGFEISQFWLLKALGNRSIRDASRILGALSDDVVAAGQSEDSDYDPLIEPKSRLIAEEVLSISVPDLAHRLTDWHDLITTANLQSESEGNTIAHILRHKGPLVTWIEDCCGAEHTQAEQRVIPLYEAALSNRPINPRIEITLRQHFALFLRRHDRLEEALIQIEIAHKIETENDATTHILGLVHERRATLAWQDVASTDAAEDCEELLAAARGYEADALEFFRKVREARPHEEYGYVSEAAYHRNKVRALSAGDHGMVRLVRDEANGQLFDALALLTISQGVVPRERQDYLPTTKADVLASIGQIDIACNELLARLDCEEDPVRRCRLLRRVAGIAAEQEDWGVCAEHCSRLIESGEHDAGLYLLLDKALRLSDATVRERKQWLRESVQIWNKNDVATLVNYAILACYLSDYRLANETLLRADNVIDRYAGAAERDRIRHVVRISPVSKSGHKRFTGKVDHMWRAFEGEISSPELPEAVFFRIPNERQNQIVVNSVVTFSLAIRVRGLRAISVESVTDSAP